jgi:hypothetical protein
VGVGKFPPFALLAGIAALSQGCGTKSGQGSLAADDGGADAAPMISCSWMTEMPDAKCSRGACPITFGAVGQCPADPLGGFGLAVAPAADATWLVAGGEDAYAFRLNPGSFERELGVPSGLAGGHIFLSVAPNSSVHVAGDSAKDCGNPAAAGGALWATFNGHSWTSNVVFAEANPDCSGVRSLQVGLDSAPRLWAWPPGSEGIQVFTRAGTGMWNASSAGAFVPGSAQGFTLTRDGTPASLFWSGAGQLNVTIGGSTQPIGSPTGAGSTPVSLTSALTPTAPSTGALLAVAIAHGDGIRVAWLDGAGSHEVSAPGTAALMETNCDPPPGQCTGTCTETGAGVVAGVLDSTRPSSDTSYIALARTTDGVAWLVYITETLDTTLTWTPEQSGDGLNCVGMPSSNGSTFALHVVKVVLDASSIPSEVLTMQVGLVSGPGFDAHAFGTDLGIAYTTYFGVAHVLRIDTTRL